MGNANMKFETDVKRAVQIAVDLNYNPILDTDSYKLSHFSMYPEGTEAMSSYIEPRGPKNESVIFFGLQRFLKRYLSKPITAENIDEAEVFAKAHGEPFNREGWEHILTTYDGYIPIRIKAVKEGTRVRTSNVLVVVECDDPKVFWLASYFETAILRGVWYPTTIATNSYKARQIIKQALLDTGGSLDGLPFMLHDFGGRGVTCEEQAQIGGMAHLTSFMGSDTISGVRAANLYYNEPMAAFSVPAAEHTVCTAEGQEGEINVFKRILKSYKGWPIISVVSDSYDIYNAIHLWASLKEEIKESGARLVVRPDSGNPTEVVSKVVRLLEQHFGSTMNSKGFKVLNNVRVLQGDGVDNEAIRGILLELKFQGFSAENMVFGSGGALLQKVNRDTFKFAQKSSALKVNGVWRDVYKDPVTDPGKASKKGRISLYRSKLNGEMMTLPVEAVTNDEWEELLEPVWDTGVLLREHTLSEIRQRVAE